MKLRLAAIAAALAMTGCASYNAQPYTTLADSQIAIKQSGTNGGGFYGANAAHPLENPNPFTNFIELIAILLIPASLCFAFGRSVKNNKQGVALFVAMAICLVVALGVIVASECIAPAQLLSIGTQTPAVRTFRRSGETYHPS